MADTVQQIKDRLSIQDVVSGYVKLERAGSSMRARCPFHAERTPSFHVSPERGTYHCFGCGVGGDIFSFVQAIEGVDFKGALRILAERAGVKIEYRGGRKEDRDDKDRLFEVLDAATIFYQSQLNDTAREYLKKRGVNDETIRSFRLGWAGDAWSDASDFLKQKKFTEREILDAGLAKKNEKGNLTDKFRNRIVFPIADSAGRIIGFSGRTFGEKASPEAPKYLNSPETPLFQKSKVLYGFDRAKQSIRKHNFAVLVEGQMDLLLSHQAGWGNTVAVSGTAFTSQHATLVHRMAENLVIALDSDQAGIKAAGKAARAALAAGLNVKVAALPSDTDPADLILKEGAEAWKTAIREAKDIITFLLDVLQKHAPMRDKFRRAVETIVLPFLSDVQSPIAREQYLREIAQRLGVSESAVSEALAKVPVSPEFSPGGANIETQPKKNANISDRARNAFALLLWQASLPKPVLDVDAYENELIHSIGKEELKKLQTLSTEEQESLRFLAGERFGKSLSVKREAKTLLDVLLKERLSNELREVTEALKEAEAAGNEEAMEDFIERCRILTSEIAKL
ncbi:MAG: DNA primase [Parcubacteria group bacterium Gr01-1014_8]|nr:MAG: DNA primase [Parcubacteria group bacterium Gr01-1014_8]